MEELITLKQLKAYDRLKTPPVIYVDELPESPENAIYGIKHEDTETHEYLTLFTDILSSYFTETSNGKWKIKEGYTVQVTDNEPFKSAALVNGNYYIYAGDDWTGMYPNSYSPFTKYPFIVSEEIVHTDFYAAKAEDKTFVKLANVDEVERYFVRVDTKGKANGVASLDANGRVPVEQMPVQAFVYLGEWDASTGVYPPDGNTPGDFYEVSVPGIIESVEFLKGDWIVWSSDGWHKSENKNYVTSVNKKRGEVEVYGDNTEIETPSESETKDSRTIKEYIDAITVDGNEQTDQNIVSKAVLDVEELPSKIEDKVYRKSKVEIKAVTFFADTDIAAYLKGLGLPENTLITSTAEIEFHSQTTSTYDLKEFSYSISGPSVLISSKGRPPFVTTGFVSREDTDLSYQATNPEVYAKDTKLVTDKEWEADKGNIAYKNKENTFTETNTFDDIKANSIGKDNTEITFEEDTVGVTGDLQVKCIKEPEAIDIETPALSQNGKYIVVKVDGEEADVGGSVESIAVVESTTTPEAGSKKVTVVRKPGQKALVYAGDVLLGTSEGQVFSVDNNAPDDEGNITTTEILTKQEYLDLVAQGKDNPDINYYVVEEDTSAEFINDAIESLVTTWSSKRIKAAIEAATPLILNDSVTSTSQGWTSSKIQAELNKIKALIN